ncbi:hypothetical protein J6590_105728 [Homalodisca vitripennis]|nr:hypothetical protein J6590_105728 [Homalodisca vitripennis]
MLVVLRNKRFQVAESRECWHPIRPQLEHFTRTFYNSKHSPHLKPFPPVSPRKLVNVDLDYQNEWGRSSSGILNYFRILG